MRLKDSRKIQSTALDRVLPAQDKELHKIVHAHSAATVSQSYIINPTALFEKGTAYLHGSTGEDTDTTKEAQEQFEENQRHLRQHMQEVQENKTKLSMSTRERNSRQSISSRLRNSILYGILEMKEVDFSKRMLKCVPRNQCGRHRYVRNWDQFILGFFQSQQSLADLAVKEIRGHASIQSFCSKIFASLRAWNRTRILKTSAGPASFLALSHQPRKEMKSYGQETTDETDEEEVIELDLTVEPVHREYSTDVGATSDNSESDE